MKFIDGAFYGPKIDIHVHDSINRKHQCATIQLDFQLPQRFELEYTDTNNQLQTPVMIHRAIYGSLERFFAILSEHLKGKWPFWLSPKQCCILTINDKFGDYANDVCKTLKSEGFAAHVDNSGNTIKKKIVTAQKSQYNFILVVGQKEVDKGEVNVRSRDSQMLGTMKVEAIVDMFKDLEKSFK
eukprot:TRINITY_DN1984_c0_g1_i1.p1 TRINITY_DN1984_c0_g1~~TRINITY_DN1984_c0_g1_i1.p1  ORF type:complete len:184 (-),score=20.78 TRINITY_DN1984_c0_g1_i1:30-581(-)